ncbi:MAG: 2'-5' RNA ligase family protein [Pseudomonadota bacterium]
MNTDPIILTLQFDEGTADFFERQRRSYFPPALNKIPAHLTLFHALPGADADAILKTVAGEARREPFSVAVEGLMPLGRGVAYKLSSATLQALRQNLAAQFGDVLTRQDREKFRPHVTVQNKVSPQQARETLGTLSAEFSPFSARAEGLQLWWYRGGPWAPLAAVAFEP